LTDVSKSDHRVVVPLPDRSESVSVAVSAPASFETAAILAHGAGSNMHTPALVELQGDLSDAGVAAVRFNFLYTEARRRAPDRAPVLEACWRAVADWVKSELRPAHLFLGGRSMGGRMASHLGAEGYPCTGLFFLGYPLHPPRQESKLRKDHLSRITVPMLFVSGSRDPLCNLDLLREALAPIQDRAELHVIEGGDHSLRVPRSSGRTDRDVAREVSNLVLTFFSRAAGTRPL